MKTDYSAFLPLSPAVLHILMVLARQDLHGYGIMQEVARESAGQYRLGPGTLYDNLQKLIAQALVEDVPGKSATSDPRRRYYSLTPSGRGVLSAEIERLEKALGAAKLALRTARTGRTS